MKKVLKNKIFWILFILLTIVSTVLFYSFSIYLDIRGNPNKEEELENVIIDEHGAFVLYFDTTEYQQELFNQLKEVSYSDESTEEELVEYLDVYSQNFIADFLTLNVKNTTLNRTGGEKFLVPELQNNYFEVDGVADYYFARNYYVREHKKTYEEELPEIVSLEFVESSSTTVDYYDATNVNEEKLQMQAFNLSYNVSYANQDAEGFVYYETVEVTVAKWNDAWTIIEFRSDLYDESPEVINMYE